MNSITPSALQALLAVNPQLPLLDVRTPSEFDEVHVTGAFNEPLSDLKPKALVEAGRLPQDQPIYLLCRSGARASKAAEKFAAEGFSHALVVEGGTQAWYEAGFPVTRGESKVISLERQVRIAAGALVLSGVLLSFFVHPAFIFLSGFVGAGLIFAGITDWCGMGLLLAKAPWNQR
jgi:rhodanese-related sulfurtransferase